MVNDDFDVHKYYIERQELDRKRIASELHDTSLQNLTHIIHQIDLASLFMDVDIEKAKLELTDVSNQLRKITKEIRNTIFDLRPMSFDDLGFLETIRQYTLFIEKKYSIKIELEYIDDISKFFTDEQNLEIYRIMQECLINSAKHSNGKLITLSIYKNENSVIIEVCDDGVGFSVESICKSNHYGLKIMNERVSYLSGSLIINSKIDAPLKTSITQDKLGSYIIINIPLEKGDEYGN